MKKIRDEIIRQANVIGFGLVALFAFMISVVPIGNSIDQIIRKIRYENISKEHSGEIILISMDEKSLKGIGNYPWKREVHAELIETLQGKGVRKLGFDIGFIGEGSYPDGNIKLKNAIANSEFPIGLAVPGNDTGKTTNENSVEGMWPYRDFLDAGAEVFSIWAVTNESGQFEYGNPTVLVDGKPMTAFAAWLSEKTPESGSYLIDWSYDPEMAPSYSYIDILKGKVNASELSGKTLIIGPDASVLNDAILTADGDYTAGARAQIVAAETIKAGTRGIYDSRPIIAMTLLLCGMMMLGKQHIRKHLYIGMIPGILVAAQFYYEGYQGLAFPVGQAIAISIFATFISIGVELVRYFHRKMSHHEGTGIPNLVAFQMAPKIDGSTIVIKINNHLDILAELGPEGRDKVMSKIAQRIEFGTHGREVYQIDDASFAWKADDSLQDSNWQIDSIMALLMSGATIDEMTVDIFATAGIERDTALNVEKAVNNASVAATRAQSRGIAWEIYEKSDTDEKWKISVVSEISKALDKGDIWVAYQPKVNATTNEVIGAEALVRWNHPERGNVRPDAFIPLLEKANRTQDLTRFILNRALSDFSKLERGSVAINISPTMIGDGSLSKMINEALDAHNYDPARLTIEITESEKFTNPETLSELEQIHAKGVRISIDDYGMGNSTVNYLRILPADELKIDRSFIANVLSNKSDRMVVASTIHLAHELGLKVVAEGVESEEIQKYLGELQCDFIQGYHTGKPVTFDNYKEAAKLSEFLSDKKVA